MELLFGAFVVVLCLQGIGDIGCFMFEVPWRILEAAKSLKAQGLTVLAYPLYAIGLTLHVLVRVIWYGAFIALGAGFIWFLADLALAAIKSFF